VRVVGNVRSFDGRIDTNRHHLRLPMGTARHFSMCSQSLTQPRRVCLI
jgi:hypothetical protein